MRILIVGGGTGGHIYPAIAIAEEIIKRKYSLLAIGRADGMDKNIYEKYNINFKSIDAVHLPRKSLWQIVLFPFKLVKSIFQSIKHILVFNPDVAIATGGYVSVPVLTAAILCKTPYVIQEQNTIPGRANRLFSKWSKKTFITFEESANKLNNTIHSGLPIRKTVIEARPNFEKLGFARDTFNILFFGGSQGALNLCQCALCALEKLQSAQFKWNALIQTGEKNYNSIRSEFNKLNLNNVSILLNIEDIGGAISASDFIVARAGASSIFEIAAHGKPSLLIPYPFAKDNHQLENAKAFEKAGACYVIQQSELTQDLLLDIIIKLKNDERLASQMSKAALSFAKNDSAKIIIDIIENIVNKIE